MPATIFRNQTIAEKISKLPFYTACREADQLCIRFKEVDGDCIWKFEDGSQLTSYTDINETIAL